MKKGWKTFWIVCAILAGIGLVLCIAGFAIGVSRKEVRNALRRGGVGLHNYETHTESEVHKITPEHENREEEYMNIKELEVEVGCMQVNVMTDENTEVIRVEKKIPENVDFRCYQEGSTLKLKEKCKHKQQGKNEGIVNVYIPKGKVFEKAEFTVGVGAINVSKIDAKELDIECGVGQVVLTAAGKETDYNYKLEMGVGNVSIGDKRFSGLGRNRKINNHAGKKISVECGVGQVTVTFDAENE